VACATNAGLALWVTKYRPNWQLLLHLGWVYTFPPKLILIGEGVMHRHALLPMVRAKLSDLINSSSLNVLRWKKTGIYSGAELPRLCGVGWTILLAERVKLIHFCLTRVPSIARLWTHSVREISALATSEERASLQFWQERIDRKSRAVLTEGCWVNSSKSVC
jgi:hypothetical protein